MILQGEDAGIEPGAAGTEGIGRQRPGKFIVVCDSLDSSSGRRDQRYLLSAVIESPFPGAEDGRK